MEGCTAAFWDAIWAEDGGSTFFAEVASDIFEFVVREKEVVKLASLIVLFLAFLYLLRPHGAVNVDKLVYLEGN